MVTKYEPHSATPDQVDPAWLEETRPGGLDGSLLQKIAAAEATAVRDADGDGLWEVSQIWLQRVTGETSLQALPLATYFRDSPPSFTERSKRLQLVPRALRNALQKNDFHQARAYFKHLAKGASDPLKAVADPLARYLAAVARHEGINIDDTTVLQNPSGFSVDSNGRLRFDCGIYAQLARFILQDIPGGKFEYVHMQHEENSVSNYQENSIGINKINLPSRIPALPDPNENLYRYGTPAPIEDDQNGAHLILVVSVANNRHLIIDNNEVKIWETDDVWAEVKLQYPQFTAFTRRSDYVAQSRAQSF